MNFEELKSALKKVNELNFRLPDGTSVPAHFHITEAGLVTKDFIDCGGTVRSEKNISLQLWSADDFNHRLKAEKLLKIIDIFERTFPVHNYEIEIEYQGPTIGKYALDFDGKDFLLLAKFTDCLASDACGIPSVKEKKSLVSLSSENSCTPGGGCC